MTFLADLFIANLSSDRERPFVVWVVFMLAAGSMAGLALHAPELRGNLLTHKPLWALITCCMTVQTVRVSPLLPQHSKGIGMVLLFPLLEVFKMTKSAFPVANIIWRFFSADLKMKRLDKEGSREEEGCLKEQDDEETDSERRFRHSRDPEI